METMLEEKLRWTFRLADRPTLIKSASLLVASRIDGDPATPYAARLAGAWREV